MNDESDFTLGSSTHRRLSQLKFQLIFERMEELMKRARSIEFRLKLAQDIGEHAQHLKETGYDQFAQSNFEAPRPKIDRLIRKVASKRDQAPLQLVRQIADALAHADYWKAREKISQFEREHGLETQLNTDPVPERSVIGVRDSEGEKAEFVRKLISSSSNMIVEEFLVFEHQNYATAANEIFAKVEEKYDFAKIAWEFELAMIARAIRPENKRT